MRSGGRLRALDPRRVPVTTGLAGILLITTLVLRHLVDDDRSVLQVVSTNVENLGTAPLRSLLLSALFLPDSLWLPYAAALAVTVAPLERRVGSLRALAVVASGHVLVSLVTEGGVALGILAGWLPRADAHQIDVGVSYCVWTAAGAVLALLPARRRWAVAAVLSLGVLVPLVLRPDMTAAGHALCYALGLAWSTRLAREGAGPAPA